MVLKWVVCYIICSISDHTLKNFLKLLLLNKYDVLVSTVTAKSSGAQRIIFTLLKTVSPSRSCTYVLRWSDSGLMAGLVGSVPHCWCQSLWTGSSQMETDSDSQSSDHLNKWTKFAIRLVSTGSLHTEQGILQRLDIPN